MEIPHNSPDETQIQAALEAAAALGQFDREVLEALVGVPVEELLSILIADGSIIADGDGYRSLPGDLELEPGRKIELVRQAVASYGGRWEQGSPVAEQGYVLQLTSYCELLLRTEPSALAPALAGVPIERLTDQDSRHLLRYYTGLGEGLADHLGTARAIFAALLAEPNLAPLVRGRALNSGALFAQMQGDHQGAMDAYRASFAIWERLGDRRRQANGLHNLGILQYELHMLEEAEQQFRAAAAIYADLGDDHHLAMSFNELGLVYRDAGRWEEAQDALERAAGIFEREGAQHVLGIVLGNIGEVKLAQGRYDDAEQQLGQALQLMTSRIYAVDYQVNLGLIAQARGNDQAALEHYQSARQLAEELGRREIAALIHYRTGHALQRLGRAHEARASYAAAMEAVEVVRAPLRDIGLLIGLMGRWQLIYEAAFLLCVEQGDLDSAFEVSERARARAFADQLADHASLVDTPAAPTTAAEARAMLSDRVVVSFFATGLRGVESGLIDTLPPAAQGLRELLASPARLSALVLTQGTLQSFTATLNPNVLQSGVGQHDGTRFLVPRILRRLSDELFAPIGALLEPLPQLVVIPYGPLHQVPFAALTAADGQTLLDRTSQLSIVPSVTVLLQILARPIAPAPNICLALGYQGDRADLRHTEAEARTIADRLGGEHWIGRPGALKMLAERGAHYRLLHLACHGEFNLDDPLASWLEVGPGQQISAEDILSQVRLSADLVTLSACRSGVSRVLRGDEPMGLVRAFLGAGAKAVLVTLWPVEDSSARLLMERFYAELLSGPALRPAVALRAAQLFLRTLHADEARRLLGTEPAPYGEYPYADPRYWGGYYVVGAG
jgi:tetratricopeptide (TPR) repeat protein